MRRALYDPEAGYYTKHIKAVGGGSADFATSASLDPGFSEALGNWIEREIVSDGGSLRGDGGKWHLIELGGGAGHLAKGILRSLGWGGRRRTRYHIVEVSPVLREAQRSTLGRRAGAVIWHTSIADALRRAGGRVIVFSNEFADAFPATVVQWDADSGSWYEVCLEGLGVGRFAEVLCPLDQQTDSVVFENAQWDAVALADGQRCEVLFSWRDWLGSWTSEAQAVALLTIDYGDVFPDLYRGRREGTLRAYHQHRRIVGTEVFARAGRQDLTTDVNFTDLQRWGENAGLVTESLEAQREFLNRFGAATPDGEPAPAAAFLQDPAGAGEAFRVLCQRKL